MGYEKILEELNDVISSKFSMDELKEICRLWQKASCIYGSEILSKRKDAKERYEEVSGSIYDVAFTILKNKLGFEDEVIKKIISFMIFTDRIEEIYVIDGNVFAQIGKSKHFGEPEDLCFGSTDGFTNITSPEFNNSDSDYYKNFFLAALINAVKPFVKNKEELDNAIYITDGKINYGIPNFGIYANHSLSEIISDRSGNEITKVLVKYNDMLLYFDLKVRDEFIIVSQNEYHTNVISEMLDNKSKVYKKI